MNVLEILQARHVRRFHTLPFIGHQTVADHTWGACIILMSLCQGKTCGAVQGMLVHMLMHDVPERWVGDMPGDTKAQDPALKDAMDKAEAAHMERLFGELPGLHDSEVALVKMADSLDLMATCCDQQQLGNDALRVAFNNASSTVTKLLKTYPNPHAYALQLSLRGTYGL